MKKVTKWNPVEDLIDIQKDMSSFFRRAVGLGSQSLLEPYEEGAWIPSLDLFTKNGNLMVKAHIPGVNPADIDVSVRNGELIIKGERKAEKEMNEENVYRMESSFGKFMRSITLPPNITSADIKANYTNGVIEIEVKGAGQQETPKEEKIDVKVA